MNNFVIGANKENHHIKNCNIGRDFGVMNFADLRMITEKDKCPRCQSPISFARGIEVGHVFKLGTKYSKAMNATFLDKDGKDKLMIMGCYGIGIGRTSAACIEQNHDKDGIVWPMPIAPFHVIITPVNIKEEDILKTSEEIYRLLEAEGIEVVLDDRDERAGVKFIDADLIGIPLRITVGKKNLINGNVEIRFRSSGEVKIVPVGTVRDYVVDRVKEKLGETD
ncbi:MAG: His/Gly/Thr/Pro-type tRNA ligase C-terminal domain-containing protein, partial [Thermodesulfobacteriota bacterium]|nr:His/Gly/Thr/Pro-type tRNA ligase C-terminal domain-containing protein [Thermodesulfobacteriota bacterium]